MDSDNRRHLPKTGYPRRRAVAACLTCREKKRKCDNLRPACSSCEQIGIPCEYIKRDASAFDAASLQILDRLSIIENLVRDIHPSSSLQSLVPLASQRQFQTSFASPSHLDKSSVKEGIAYNFNLDTSCKAATDSVLRWPVFDRFLYSQTRFKYIDFQGHQTYTYLNDFLIQPNTASQQTGVEYPLDSSVSISISTERNEIQGLVDRFCKRVNIKNPILSQQVAAQLCQEYYENGPLFNLKTCLVLLMCALGAVSMEFNPALEDQSPETAANSSARCVDLRLASCYYAAAEKRLGYTISSFSTLAAQCLCLAGIYQMYLVNPMHALRMFHTAGSSLQVATSTGTDSAEESSQIYSSLFWTCFKSEREILAEIPISAPALPTPGHLESYPPPPDVGGMSSEEWASQQEDSWYFFLSEIALRRITDQVADMASKFIEAKDHDSSNIEELIPVVAEFERQAETFREHLPPAINFPDVPHQARTEWQQYSRSRYYRLLELMHRPFLYAALHGQYCNSIVRVLAEKALFNALRYLQHSHISHRHHGTWLQLRNVMRETCLLLAASKATDLQMPHEWEGGLAKALATFELWSSEFPACKTYTDVISTLIGYDTVGLETVMQMN